MALERRLAVGALVLLAALPVGIPLALEPGPSLGLAALVLLATLTTVGLPVGPHLSAGAAVAGAALLLAQGAWLMPPATGLSVALLPALVLASGLGPGPAAAAAAVGVGAASIPDLGRGWGWLDWVGVAVLLALALALVVALLRAGLELRVRREVVASGQAVREAHARDQLMLQKVAAMVAPRHAPGVCGQGWGPRGLGLAAELAGGRVLVGAVVGDPLATLSAGWALRAWARAGQIDPLALMGLARAELDELLAGAVPPWLGVLDRATGELAWVDAAGIRRTVAVDEVTIGVAAPCGEPLFATPPPPPDPIPEWEPLPPLPEQEMEGPAPKTAALWAVSAALAAVAAAIWSEPGWLALAVPGLGASARAVGARARAARREAQDEAEEAMELRDEVHRVLARDHGGLLPHRVTSGDVQVTAHRLRGEGLDGTFTELFLDGDRRIHVIAGEVAGQCVCDRFLALAAGVYARALALRGVAWPELFARTRRMLSPDAHQLRGGPPKMVLGHALVTPAGRCEGHGVLATLVLAEASAAQVVERGQVDPEHRLYFSPATVRPGPEDDDVPALRPAVAAARVRELIDSGRFSFERESLASLFARVFDGDRAPAHGTLLEVSAGARPAPGETTQRAA